MLTISDRPDIVQLLLDHGANIDFNDTNFGMPLHIAAMKNHLNCAEILLKGGKYILSIYDNDNGLKLLKSLQVLQH